MQSVRARPMMTTQLAHLLDATPQIPLLHRLVIPPKHVLDRSLPVRSVDNAPCRGSDLLAGDLGGARCCSRIFDLRTPSVSRNCVWQACALTISRFVTKRLYSAHRPLSATISPRTLSISLGSGPSRSSDTLPDGADSSPTRFGCVPAYEDSSEDAAFGSDAKFC